MATTINRLVAQSRGVKIMVIKFYKYHGTGNDFVLIDNREKLFDRSNNELVKNLCNRRFGIGGDGLILLQYTAQNILEMVYYNSDGNEGSMCGNGGRCFVQFAKDLALFSSKITFTAPDGLHEAYIEHGLIHLKMNDVGKIEKIASNYFLNTGSPHFVSFVSDISNFDVVNIGRQIRYSDPFKPNGTNVNFVERVGNTLCVRTYERGVEDETYSCGTGVTAAAIVAQSLGLISPIEINTKGGNLKVSYENKEEKFTNIYLIGPAVKVFEGEFDF